MTRTERLLILATTLIILTATALRATAALVDAAVHTGWVVPAVAFTAGAALAFRAGQYWRGYQHARGIRRSHWQAIGGGHR